MFSRRRPLFHVSFFNCKDLDQTVQMHMHAYAALELCWSDVSWASHYMSFEIFAFAKVLTRPYFTYVYLPAKTQVKLYGCSLYCAIKRL